LKKLTYLLALTILLLTTLITGCTSSTELTPELTNQDNMTVAPANPISSTGDMDKNQNLSATNKPTATNIPNKPATATPISKESVISDT
jgi:hypothetical protein